MAIYAPITPAQEVTAPLVQPSQPQPVTPPPQEQKEKTGILGILLIVILLIGVVGGGYLLFSQQKKDINEKSNTQVGYFSNIEDIYKNILIIEKEDLETTPKEGSSLLGVSTEKLDINEVLTEQAKVLGIEDDATVKKVRRLSELYKQAVNNATKINNLNKLISSKSSSLPASLLLKERPPISQTETFSTETIALLTYLDVSNNLTIDALTMGIDIGVAIQEVAIRKFDSTSVVNLENKINSLDQLKAKYMAIDISGLSDEMKTEHTKDLADFDKEVKIFDEILQAIKMRDGNLLEKSFQSLALESTTSSQTSITESISFWQQNPTIRSLQTVKESWQNYLKEF